MPCGPLKSVTTPTTTCFTAVFDVPPAEPPELVLPHAAAAQVTAADMVITTACRCHLCCCRVVRIIRVLS
jgi:hypothetical protein